MGEAVHGWQSTRSCGSVRVVRAISAAVAQLPYTELVGGSNPSSPTIFQLSEILPTELCRTGIKITVRNRPRCFSLLISRKRHVLRWRLWLIRFGDLLLLCSMPLPIAGCHHSQTG